jgi:hypothetical protein
MGPCQSGFGPNGVTVTAAIPARKPQGVSWPMAVELYTKSRKKNERESFII